MRVSILGLLAILAAGRARGEEPSEFRKAFDGIVAEQKKVREVFNATWRRLEAMKRDGASQADRDRVQEEATAAYLEAVEANSGRVLDLVRAHPDDPAVVTALAFVIETARAGPTDHARQALKILARDHARDPGMGKVGAITFYFFFVPEVESLLRGILDRNPSREERARACYNLADHLAYKARVLGMFREGRMTIAN